MIISDLNVLEVVEVAEVVGGWTTGNNFASGYTQTDNVTINFSSNNNFATTINSPLAFGNSASAGAKGDAINPYGSYVITSSFTKADTVAVTQLGGGSFSGSTSAAVINPVFPLVK